MMELSAIQQISVAVLPLLFAITLHEVAHGWVANQLGDPTAKMLGRLTINPIKHIDLFGTVIMPIALLILSNFNFVFGWAKPVPITWQNLKNPRRDIAFVALAGPLANLLMALAWAAILAFTKPNVSGEYNAMVFFALSAQIGILINVALMVLNLIPLPPLDGSRVLSVLLPAKASAKFSMIEPYGLFILLFLIITGAIYYVLIPPMLLVMKLIYSLFGL